MTYAHSTHRVTIFGSSFGLAEEWSTSFWLGNSTGGDLATDATQAEVDAIAALWKTFFEGTGNGVSSRWQTIGVKASLVSTTGATTPGTSAFSYYTTPITGGGTGASNHPPQCALVCTLTTAKARGYGSKGRMYLPGIGFPVGTDGRIDTSATNTLGNSLKTFFDGVNSIAAIGGSDTELVLQSKEVAGIPGHAALMSKITGIKVGNVYDTQRRRRNQLAEIYNVKTLA